MTQKAIKPASQPASGPAAPGQAETKEGAQAASQGPLRLGPENAAAPRPAGPGAQAGPAPKGAKSGPAPKGAKPGPAPKGAKPGPAQGAKPGPAQGGSAKAAPLPARVQPANRPPAHPKPANPGAAAPRPAAPPPAQSPPAPPRVIEVMAPAAPARVRRRHWGIFASFLLAVLLPAGLALWYLYAVAEDQYESRIGFAVRTEESKSALDVLSGLSGLSSASSSDTDILYEFIQSQEMVQRVDAQMDLRAVFTRPEFDPVFALKPGASLEELVAYWPRMVRVYYDSATGLIQVRAFAFTADEAQRLAQLVYSESSEMINALSAVAREDATRYAAEERDKAIERLIGARQALTAFRVQSQIVDPQADVAGQMGLLTTLQAQLAEALIEQDLLLQTTRSGDPRLEQIERRIEVIEARIAAERSKLGVGAPLAGAAAGGEDSAGYAGILGEYEKLAVDREFAEQTYLSALGAYDAAVAEAQRTSRYLAAFVRPTLAETATAPNRPLLAGLTAGFLLILWFTGVLIYYSFRDRR